MTAPTTARDLLRRQPDRLRLEREREQCVGRINDELRQLERINRDLARVQKGVR